MAETQWNCVVDWRGKCTKERNAMIGNFENILQPEFVSAFDFVADIDLF